MENESILNAAALMDGKLTERRKEIKSNIIKHVISTRDLDGKITSFKIQSAIKTEFGLEIEEPVIRSCLEELDNNDVVNHLESDTFKIIETPRQTDIRSEIEPIWLEYKNNLRSTEHDQGIDYKLDTHRDAFERIFIKFFNTAIENNKDLNNYVGKQVFENKIDEIISEVTHEKSLRNEEIFENVFFDYLNQETSKLLNFVGTIYTGIINYDLLSKERDIDFKNAPEENLKLFLDTNILIGLLCKTDDLHPVVSSLCNRATELGYELYYTQETTKEFKHVKNKALNNLEGFPKKDSDVDIGNQFITDFRNREAITENRYELEINRWHKTLKEDWDITQWNGTNSVSDQSRSLIRNWVEKLDEIEGSGEKIDPQLDHDTSLITTTLSVRQKSDQDLLVGPFSVSNNDSLLGINSMGKEELWKKGIVLHPQDWLDYLVAFSPAEFTKDKKEEVARAVISTATKFDDELELDDYLDIMAIRGEYSDKNKEFLKEVVHETNIINKLEDSIKRGDYEKLERQGQELMEEVNELLKENVSKDKKMSRVRQKYEEEREEKEKLKNKKEELEEIIEDINGVEVSNIQNVSQEVELTVQQEVQNQINSLEDQLEMALDEPLQESGGPSPPEDYSDHAQVVDYLEGIESFLATANNISDKAKNLKPLASAILTNICI